MTDVAAGELFWLLAFSCGFSLFFVMRNAFAPLKEEKEEESLASGE
jgi:hypothetical protein